MKINIILFFLIFFISKTVTTDPSKVIIIYFSRTGNTQKFANYISELSNEISVFKIEPVTLYPEDYNKTLKIVIEEQETKARPEIKNALNNVNDYEIILLGYPIWYSHLPNIVINQLEKLDLNGKIIYPFNTHGGSGIANSIDDIKSYVNNATVKDGFPIITNDIIEKDLSMNKIKVWLEKIIDKEFIEEEENEEEENKEEEINDENNNSVFMNINLYLFYFIIYILLL